MEIESKVIFEWQGAEFEGLIEKEYENAVLIEVSNPDEELSEKYLGRVVVSKKLVKPIQ